MLTNPTDISTMQPHTPKTQKNHRRGGRKIVRARGQDACV